MGSVNYSYTFSGAEGTSAVYFTLPITLFTGAFSMSIDFGSASTGIWNFDLALVRLPDNTTCYHQGVSIGTPASSGGFSSTVGTPPFAWSCTDWTHLRFSMSSSFSPPGAGRVASITVTSDSIVPGPGVCQYGFAKKHPDSSLVDAGAGYIGGLLTRLEGLWAIPATILAAVGYYNLDTLCDGPPEPDVDLEPADYFAILPAYAMTRSHAKLAQKFKRALWLQYCDCAPAPVGMPPPTPPAQVNYIQPTWYITNNNNTISNTDIANTLNLILNNNTSNTYSSRDTQQLAAASSPCAPLAYEAGFVHEGLVGQGAFGISDVVGFRVEVVSHPTNNLVVPGQPPYIWNLGWVSTLMPDGLLDEKRVTRDAQLWFPCALALADTFAYTLRAGVELRVTELVRPTSVPTVG